VSLKKERVRMEFPKAYEPKEVEEKWYRFWLERGFFHANPNSGKRPFCIVIPPPNVTGSLHMGHALNNTLQDILIRWRRMQGYETLWLPGTDHAGIATQHMVEKELAKENLTREEIGREEFLKRVWEWKEKYGRVIIEQLKRLGASCDWDRERFTMDEGLKEAVKEVFVRLYEEGLIYRGNYIINWCPRCKTALSDLEVERKEEEGMLYYLRYPLEGGGEIVVATTRPETMLGDTAVAVNPEDERYKDLVGRWVILPVVGRRIPVIADSYVDPQFGTGALKITPAHDVNDFEIAKRHDLPFVKVMDERGIMTEEAGPYKGLDRFECRRRILEDFRKDGTLVKEEPYRIVLGRCYRCQTVVEPYLSVQWFVKTKPLAEPAILAVKEKRTRIIPEQWEKVYFDWMESIRDWCISRQIWWGHRIPAWHCEDCGGITVDRQVPTRCKDCGSTNLYQDPDVLDTWFSSALWPFATLGWPQRTKELEVFYPTSVLVTGFDILFFWVARMMMMGLHFMKDVPFRDVYVHALVRDMEGQKMSKTRGNVIDPLEMIEKYGADSLRFALAILAAQGRDIKLSEQRIESARTFCNKLWNAARFCLLNLDEGIKGSIPERLTLPDKWILLRLKDTIKEVTQALEEYRFNDAALAIYHFTWHNFCDWYIELSKVQLSQADDLQLRQNTQKVLLFVLERILKLLHPFMPFITEEIWQKIPHEGESIMVSSWPEELELEEDLETRTRMERLMGVVTAIRNIRGEMGVPPSKRIKAILRSEDARILEELQQEAPYIRSLALLRELELLEGGEAPKASSTAITYGVEVYVPLSELVPEPEKEIERLKKELKRVEEDIAFLSRKLQDPSFLQKAPKEVVEKEKEKLEERLKVREKLQMRLNAVEDLLGLR
jgi:valyl-tRNA synthetase